MARQKNPEEIAAIEEAQRATSAAMTAVISYLRDAEHPTSEEAHAIIEQTLSAMGCESPDGHIVASGEQAVEPHDRGSGPIIRDTAIVIDIFPRNKKSGYFADMTRTVCIGKPSEQIQKMYDAVVAAQELVERMVKPGVACKTIQEAVETLFIDRGFETKGKGKEFKFAEGFVHSVGHGVGLKIHEAPSVSGRSEEILMEGDVITIEPGLYYPHVGGVRMEDMVLVTADGSRNLTKYPKELSLR